MVGPSTGLGHNSIVFMMEAQLHWIVSALKHLRSTGAKSLYRSADGRVDTLWPGLTWEYWLRTRRFRFRHYRVIK